jgi:hypothetical protein
LALANLQLAIINLQLHEETMMHSLRTALAFCVLFICLFPGCGQRRPPEPVRTAEDGLKELADMYRYLDYSKLPPPKKLDDLNDSFDAIPNAYHRIKSDEIVVVWGVGFSKDSEQVLAYDKKAPTDSGPVLLRNGTVKTMTAAEFKAAPKAK